ncbi:MAG: FHA domain-containing protein [Synechococcales bacterium]|nr:FHA domain-containing protein [Synechococcales bacterium]
MLVCPNCNHTNPIGAIQCEACFTPLPAMATCPNCGTSAPADAAFCGQCGFNLKAMAVPASGLPDLVTPDPVVIPPLPEMPPPPVPIAAPTPEPIPSLNGDPAEAALMPTLNLTPAPVAAPQTQLQQQVAKLLHVQTNTMVEIPPGLTIVHIGKPNDRVPPDIDVAGFPHSEVVSRIHADLRIEGDAYYIEDVGSSNGTYINNAPLPVGSRYRLRFGDRIALGKGDKVSFLFQLS